jgi:hypothetical protein
MTLNSQEVIQKVNFHLTAHPNAALQVVAEKLGITGQSIEQILREVEGASFEEFRENKRLARASIGPLMTLVADSHNQATLGGSQNRLSPAVCLGGCDF